MTTKILHHEDWQGSPLWDFIAGYFRKAGWKDPPVFSQVANQVFAVINQGRWVAECPMLDGGAIVVSQLQPYFLCPYCGSPENGNNWYQVVFPANKAGIEAILLKRPSRDNFHATSRNWLPGQTAADLTKENNDKGIS